MTKDELIEALDGLPGETLIVAATDGEGNGFRLLGDPTLGMNYCRDSQATGFATLTPELEQQGFSFEDTLDGEPCIVLWPMS
jgi:hypothetical protein